MNLIRVFCLFSFVSVVTLSASRHPAASSEPSSSAAVSNEVEMEDAQLAELREAVRSDAVRTVSLIQEGAPITHEIQDSLQRRVFVMRQVEREIVDNFGAVVVDGDNWYSVRCFNQRYLDDARQRIALYERACVLAGVSPE